MIAKHCPFPWFVLCASVILAHQAMAEPAIDWNDGATGPERWNIACDDAACSGVINFSGPTDTFGNLCEAELEAGGTLAVVVNELARSIEIVVTPPPPPGCPGIFEPVTGLEGSFGPLPAGRWRFFADTPVAAFELEFAVSPGAATGSVDWLSDGSEPQAWTLQCPDGTCEGLIDFLGPVPDQTNTCIAEQASGGSPVLAVDEVNRTVELWFAAPKPEGCPGFVSPIGGLTGSFGPLAPGEWNFFSDSAFVQFDLRFRVPQGSDGPVDWIAGDSPPGSWTATCDDLECSGDFSFSGPTAVYGNLCEAELTAGGAPVLSIREDTNSIELWFSQPAPLLCPTVIDPVAGLAGSISGLSPGTWSFYSTSNAAPFRALLEVGNTSLDWIDDAPAPTEWTVDCATPTCDGLLEFSGPTPAYVNTCEANELIGGVPVLQIDSELREIEIIVAPPAPVGCPGTFLPVEGLQGTFGPLTPGEWRFYSEAGFSDFDLTFNVADESCLNATLEPPAASINAAGGTGSFTIDVEEACVCEATVDEDFVTITSNPAIACDLGTVSYTVAPNTGAARQATISLTGDVNLDYTISQDAAYGEGEGGLPSAHTGDQNGDNVISLSELLRVIQFFNSSGLHCAAAPEDTEDGFVPGPNGDAQSCAPHASDYNPQDWSISLSELLRLIQFFNSGGYFACPEGEDGFCPGQDTL